MQNIFGAGILWGRQLTDASGNAISNPTPVKFGVAQEIGVDVSFDTKLLHGQNQFPIAIGRGKGKITGKVKMAQVNGALFNSIVFGQTLSSGIISDYSDTGAGVAIPATPFQITVTPPSTGTFVKDLGVRNAATGTTFARVASAPAAGQYSVNEATGQYTFASADNVSGIKVQIDYQYSATSTVATKSTVASLPMGYAPTFAADIYLPYNGKSLVFTLPNCVASKLAIATKLDDFTIPEINFEAFADASGNAITYALAE